ncbi:Dimerization-anchoring domain of cAMP-dependent protein kinase, regulatory subunit [Pseudocohnilembus persalinus]|uniref:Dimerization-anchoring domain of cAMP-dependent protein kinase, regulatory subunit n=1 Tax=Pseudocohnilembus persalinus TaxID=266149 RepID=A0A0V0QB20_PSEPJ|nr:Dimerization-anchoring domain of cAMP-dependent protein kinase, regulatory subunit [Pseudocohnilembus persalinus]|eukprot:KRW99437.1 Dimerization-anchoring domain of cAMP-dependent protein kinase, regulatory subunit [Pseudocohnilembus persalinus]
MSQQNQEEQSMILKHFEEKGINNLTKEQADQFISGEEYLKKHKIDVVFQEMLAHIINVQPENVKEFLISQLKQRKSTKLTYFTENDFEAFFENYEFTQEQKIPQQYVIQALELVGVKTNMEDLDKQYRSSFENGYIDKEEFLKIMNNEYNKRLF